MNEVLLALLPIVVIAAAILVAAYPFMKGRQLIDIPPVLPEVGLNIPVYDAIWGKLFSMQRKNGFGRPNLTLFNDKIKFRKLVIIKCC
jgi:hypothetical protein